MLTRVTATKGNPHGKTWPTARFEITLRADDVATLDLIRDTLDIGNVHEHSSASKIRPNTKPAVRYAVWRVGECLDIVDLFTCFPLRAKKAHQFDIWSCGVQEIARGAFRDDALIDACRTELAQARVYDQTVLDGWCPTPREALRHQADRGAAPDCLCGCGQPVLPHGGRGIPHPDNQSFARFRRGHHMRSEAQRQRIRNIFRS